MVAKATPFIGAEAFKAFADIKVPGMNMDVLVAYHQKNLDAFTKANQVAVKGFQAMAERQGEMLRSAFSGASKATEALVSGKTPEEKVRAQTEFAKDGMISALSEVQEIAGLAAATASEAAGVINARVVESFEEVRKIFTNGHAA